MDHSKLVKNTVDNLKNILEKLEIDAEINAEMVEGDNNRHYINIQITGEDLYELIGSRGIVLRSLERVLSLVMHKEFKKEAEEDNSLRVIIDINNYKAKQEESVKETAIRAITQVKSENKSIELSPMSPAFRRIVHMIVKEEGGVTSESVGEAEERRVVIKPE